MATVVGGLAPMVWRDLQQAWQPLTAFGAGVLLATALGHLVPEAAALLGDGVGWWLLIGFLAIYLVDRWVVSEDEEDDHCEHEGAAHERHLGWLALLGLLLHGVVDGVVLGSASRVDPFGFWLGAGIVLHRLPTALVLAFLLRRGGWRPASVALWIAAFALSSPVGYFAAAKVGRLTDDAGALMAFSAGTLLFVAISELLPRVHGAGPGRFLRLFAFLFGIGLVSLSTFLPAG